MKITKRQLKRIIREEHSRILHEQAESPMPPSDPRAAKLESLINDWIPEPITVELMRGNSYTIRGVAPAFVPEVTEEVEEFGGTVRAIMSNVRDKVGTKDLSIRLGGIR